MRNLFRPGVVLRTAWSARYLIWQWTCRLLASRYAGSFLGPFWALATPLLMLTVYTFVFGIVFQARWQFLEPNLTTTQSYAVILLCGMAMFQIFAETVTGSCRCVIDNPNLVKKVIFPLEILPITQVLAATVTGLAWFVLVFLTALLTGIWPTIAIFFFPLVLLPLMAFALGIGWFVAATTVYLRDTPMAVSMVLQALFFMTPIFYPESLVPAKLLFILEINPLTWFCRQFRAVLLFGQVPSLPEICLTWLLAGICCQLGFAWFAKVKKGFADVI